jgi:ankyrin repeat protein
MTHRRRLTHVFALWLVAFGPSKTALGQSAARDRVADAAARGVAAIQASQAIWSEKQACSSCHHHYQPAIAFAAAREHGIPVDERIAAAVASRITDITYRGVPDITDIDAAIQFAGIVEPVLQEGYRLLAAHAAQRQPDLATAVTARYLIARQRASGDWSGLNQRPPSSSSDFAKTAIGLRAVQLFHHRADAHAADVSIARAAEWLRSHSAPDTEGRTYQLLGLHWAGTSPHRLSRFVRELASAQQPDGGWGSVEGRASEAYSTGEALVALRDAGGLAVSDPILQRGIAFLVRTQAPDGTWHVPSRLHDPARLSPPYFESGYPYGHDQFISVHGAAWAIMALAQQLPKAPTAAQPAPLEQKAPSVQPWMETVLFGTIAELRLLLDNGLDPNASTSSGTTVLMMAASDSEKLRLLLDRGADVNARAASGFTALMVAAQYTHSDRAINLLLDRGYTVQRVADRRQSESYALPLAAHAGNASILERLHRAGEPVNARFPPLLPRAGIYPTAMAMSIRNGDREVVRTLLDLGADLNAIDGQPWSPLDAAVHNNRLDLARLFLQRGADVNAVDKAGFTPLLLAASIDFGDTGMIELLLAARANIHAKNPAGKTALDLALEYQHTRFIALLERASREQQMSKRE